MGKANTANCYGMSVAASKLSSAWRHCIQETLAQTSRMATLHIKRWQRRWRHCIQCLVDHNWTWRHCIEKRIASPVFLRLQAACNGPPITGGCIAYITASKHSTIKKLYGGPVDVLSLTSPLQHQELEPSASYRLWLA